MCSLKNPADRKHLEVRAAIGGELDGGLLGQTSC